MYGYHVEIDRPFAEVLDKLLAALKKAGFGVLSDIDVQKTMKEKLEVDMPPYRILGACNPPLAHKALEAEPEIGLLLPCNVIVRQNGDRVSVGFVDPQTMVQLTGNPKVAAIADDASERLEQVRRELSSEFATKS